MRATPLRGCMHQQQLLPQSGVLRQLAPRQACCRQQQQQQRRQVSAAAASAACPAPTNSSSSSSSKRGPASCPTHVSRTPLTPACPRHDISISGVCDTKPTASTCACMRRDVRYAIVWVQQPATALNEGSLADCVHPGGVCKEEGQGRRWGWCQGPCWQQCSRHTHQHQGGTQQQQTVCGRAWQLFHPH
jgi:hypothetical protein